MYFYRGLVAIGICTLCFTYAQEVVFDINSLVEPDLDAKEQELMQALDFKFAARFQYEFYAITHGLPKLPQSIQHSFFEHLNQAYAGTTLAAVPYQDEALPALMRQWLTQQDTVGIVETFDDYLAQKPLTAAQKQFYHILALTAFTAQKYAKTSKINPNTLSFIHTCQQAGHPVYLIGNTNGECFKALQKQEHLKYALALFDEHHRYFSYQDELLKPSANFYAAFKRHCALTKAPLVCIEAADNHAHAAADTRYLETPTCIASHDTLATLTLLLKSAN